MPILTINRADLGKYLFEQLMIVAREAALSHFVTPYAQEADRIDAAYPLDWWIRWSFRRCGPNGPGFLT